MAAQHFVGGPGEPLKRVTPEAPRKRIRRTRAQMAADVAPNLFLNERERNELLALVQGTLPLAQLSKRRRDNLITKLESVTW